MSGELSWIDVRDERLDWLNVADWEPKGGGLQPVRVPKAWRDQWPPKTARRAMSAAGMAVRFRTDSKQLLLRVTFVDFPDNQPATPASGWERSRPNFFSLYRDGKYAGSMAGLTHFEQQEVTIFNDPEISVESEVQVLLPFYYRNAEVILHGIGIDAGAKLSAAAPDRRPRVFFHGDSITQGHGVTSPRETYCLAGRGAIKLRRHQQRISAARPGPITRSLKSIAARSDWDVLSIMLGTNSFGGTDAYGKPETAAQYAQKYDAFLETIRRAHAQKPILCVTPILNRADLDRGGNQNGERPELYREGITQVVKQRQKLDKNLHLADGLAMVNDPLFLLVTDRVHPNDAGMNRIANGVAAALQPILANLGERCRGRRQPQKRGMAAENARHAKYEAGISLAKAPRRKGNKNQYFPNLASWRLCGRHIRILRITVKRWYRHNSPSSDRPAPLPRSSRNCGTRGRGWRRARRRRTFRIADGARRTPSRWHPTKVLAI